MRAAPALSYTIGSGWDGTPTATSQVDGVRFNGTATELFNGTSITNLRLDAEI
jgi:hypothetical protein